MTAKIIRSLPRLDSAALGVLSITTINPHFMVRGATDSGRRITEECYLAILVCMAARDLWTLSTRLAETTTGSQLDHLRSNLLESKSANHLPWIAMRLRSIRTQECITTLEAHTRKASDIVASRDLLFRLRLCGDYARALVLLAPNLRGVDDPCICLISRVLYPINPSLFQLSMLSYLCAAFKSIHQFQCVVLDLPSN